MNKLLYGLLTLVISAGIAYGIIWNGLVYFAANPATIQQLQAEVQTLRADAQTLQFKLTNEELIRQDLEHRLRVVERRNLINMEAE